MSSSLLKCAMCGFEYDSEQHRACASCPLQKGCDLVCCPVCGYQTVNLHKSVLARLADSLLSFSPRAARQPVKRVELTLADVPPGNRAMVGGFLDGLPIDRRAQLQAYGLIANDWVQVLQQAPVTVIQIHHTELALEAKLASQIKVERIGQ
jgi:Fe2+ transport system protein FeoA